MSVGVFDESFERVISPEHLRWTVRMFPELYKQRICGRRAVCSWQYVPWRMFEVAVGH